MNNGMARDCQLDGCSEICDPETEYCSVECYQEDMREELSAENNKRRFKELYPVLLHAKYSSANPVMLFALADDDTAWQLLPNGGPAWMQVPALPDREDGSK